MPKTPRTRKPARRRKRAVVHHPVERVLALDPSSRCVGWCLFENGRPAHYGRYLQVGTDGAHGEKLARYEAWLAQLLEKYRPDRLIYEAPYQGRMRHTFGILSRYVGAVEAVHFRHFGREIDKQDAVPAHLVKKALGVAKGRNHDDNKRIVVKYINQTYGLRLRFSALDKSRSQDDVADAIAVNRAWHLLYADAC